LDLPALTTVDSLSIIGEALTSLRLPALVTVQKTLSISVAVLTRLTLPELTTVGHTLTVDSAPRRDDPATPQDESGLPSVLASVSLPKLTSVTMDLTFTHHPVLAEVDLPVLTESGGLSVDSQGLTSLNLPALSALHRVPYTPPCTTYCPTSYSSGGLKVYGSALTSLDVPLLSSVGGNLNVSGAGALLALSLPALTTVTGEVRITDNMALASLSAPLLSAVDDLYVSNHPSLSRLVLPLLTHVRFGFGIYNNAVLPQCQVEALLAGLSAKPLGGIVIYGNDTSASCP
jgi:hypothetical protein